MSLKIEKEENIQNPDHKQNVLNEPFENFDTSFADIPRYGSLTKLARNLEKLALMVAGGKPLPELEMRFDKVCSIKPKNLVTSLEITGRLLANSLSLTNADRNAILNELLTARKMVSKQVIEEGSKCSLMIGFAQFVNLVRAWRVVRGANALADKDYVKVETLLMQTIGVCEQTKLLMAQYTNAVDSKTKANVLEKLKEKTKEIQAGYINCAKLIDALKSDLLVGIVGTQLVEIRHNEGARLNPDRAKKSFSLNCLFEKSTLLVPIGYTCAALLDPKVSLTAGKAKDKLKEIKAKLVELENKLAVIEQTKREAEKLVQCTIPGSNLK